MRLLRTSLVALAAVAGLALPALAQDAVKPFADSSRVVAIGGSLLEIVYALDEDDKLVARDSTGLYPPEALSLPDVGYMRALSPEGVLSASGNWAARKPAGAPPKFSATPVACTRQSSRASAGTRRGMAREKFCSSRLFDGVGALERW